MNVFDQLIDVDKKGNITYNRWIEWDHIGIPNQSQIVRDIARILLALQFHCLTCTALDGCYFVDNNKPEYPQHERCDCKIISIDKSTLTRKANAYCDIRKFTEYVFSNQSKGKNQIFYNLGFSKQDSQHLQTEYCKQALKNYLNGNYLLKNLDMHGQRIAIPITLKGKTFYSGWMICPEGKIQNITPFGGKINEKI